jgi:sulfide dehydrogenase [flavocytochrome c] flavoprotein chain
MMRRRHFVKLTALAGVALTTSQAASARARVVIVGGGFAGSTCALALRRLDSRIDVTLIDADERYVTCPMSNEVLVGERSIASLTIHRDGLAHAGVRFVCDRAIAVDGTRRRVSLASGKTIEFDRLVIAPGIRFLWGTPEGYDEAASAVVPHAWMAGAQTELLAKQLRAMEDGGLVAISVPGGLMRCPPGPYERATLIADFLQRKKPRSKILIFDANNHFPRQQEFEEVWRSSYPGLIEWISPFDGGVVERVDARTRTLYTSRGAQRVAVANIIPAQAPAQLAVDAGLATGHGWCPVASDSFESKHVSGVHVIGDACIAGAMPKAASAASSQAHACAAAIAASLEGKPVRAAEFDSVCYSMLGRGHALAIRGRFAIVDGEIRSVETAQSETLSPSEQAAQAKAWYAAIRAESFGG